MKYLEAEKFYKNRNYQACFDNLSKINKDDFHKMEVIPLYSASLVELGKLTDLYQLAHTLADDVPESYISWFAVVIRN